MLVVAAEGGVLVSTVMRPECFNASGPASGCGALFEDESAAAAEATEAWTQPGGKVYSSAGNMKAITSLEVHFSGRTMSLLRLKG